MGVNFCFSVSLILESRNMFSNQLADRMRSAFQKVKGGLGVNDTGGRRKLISTVSPPLGQPGCEFKGLLVNQALHCQLRQQGPELPVRELYK